MASPFVMQSLVTPMTDAPGGDVASTNNGNAESTSNSSDNSTMQANKGGSLSDLCCQVAAVVGLDATASGSAIQLGGGSTVAAGSCVSATGDCQAAAAAPSNPSNTNPQPLVNHAQQGQPSGSNVGIDAQLPLPKKAGTAKKRKLVRASDSDDEGDDGSSSSASNSSSNGTGPIANGSGGGANKDDKTNPMKPPPLSSSSSAKVHPSGQGSKPTLGSGASAKQQQPPRRYPMRNRRPPMELEMNMDDEKQTYTHERRDMQKQERLFQTMICRDEEVYKTHLAKEDRRLADREEQRRNCKRADGDQDFEEEEIEDEDEDEDEDEESDEDEEEDEDAEGDDDDDDDEEDDEEEGEGDADAEEPEKANAGAGTLPRRGSAETAPPTLENPHNLAA